jgi:hypothetical protein
MTCITIHPIGFMTGGQTSRREFRKPVAAGNVLDVSRDACGVEHFQRLQWYMTGALALI